LRTDQNGRKKDSKEGPRRKLARLRRLGVADARGGVKVMRKEKNGLLEERGPG